ncbi:MAG: hypothetical protein BWZ04_00245 [Firmicutes bacterium ADurb.BinA205]|nr:MAG: hypothetical protein BWZ04_00245 [Firmicutes bacterium ADurb.BinA205]
MLAVFKLFGETEASGHASLYHPEQDEEDYHGCNDKGDTVHLIDRNGVRRHSYLMGLISVYSVRSHQEAVSIDTVGSTGHQSDVVLIGNDIQAVQFRRQNYFDIVNGVGVYLVEDSDSECIILHQLVNISEQL